MDIKLDPNNSLPANQSQHLRNMLGILPPWIIKALTDKQTLGNSIYNSLEEAYGFPITPIKGATIDDKGTHSYPRDPDLEPIALFKLGSSIVYVYKYGLVAIKEDENSGFIVVRMD